MSKNWFVKQYDDIKGNLKWALLGPIWVVIVWVANRLLRMIPQIPTWAIWLIVLVASSIVFILVARIGGGRSRPSNTAQTATNTLATSPNFDATTFFKTAYPSPLQPEVEQNLRAAAQQNQPDDREGFYVKLTAAGVISYMYDIAWAYIFKSQLLLLMELNRRPLLAPDAKVFYDKAVTENPAAYAQYTFGQWLNFMKSYVLLLQHPLGQVEITIRGRDFLKYLVHKGLSADDKRL